MKATKNGMGKTTLIKTILGKDTVESGRILFEPDVSVGYLDQNIELVSECTVYDEVYSANQAVLDAMKRYETALQSGDEKLSQKATDEMDATDAWNYESRVNLIISKLDLFQSFIYPSASFSGGFTQLKWCQNPYRFPAATS